MTMFWKRENLTYWPHPKCRGGDFDSAPPPPPPRDQPRRFLYDVWNVKLQVYQKD